MFLPGAGGTRGGIGRFFLGLMMMIAGTYLFLDAIEIWSSWGMRGGMFNIGGFNLPGGLILVPFIFGIGMVFYNARNYAGWLLIFASMVMLVYGVIASINLGFRRISAFELLMILVLFAGGIGLFLSSLRAFDE